MLIPTASGYRSPSKSFLPNEWDNFAKAHNVGEVSVGTISKITDFGLFIRLTEGVEGLAHVSEIQRDPKSKLDKMFKVGEPIRTRIIKIDTNERKIGLSTRDVEPLAEGEHAPPRKPRLNLNLNTQTAETTAAPETTTKS